MPDIPTSHVLIYGCQSNTIIVCLADRRDLDHLLPKIHCPVLIIAGDEDPFVPVEETQGIHQRTPGSVLHVLPQTGHLVNLEQPVAFGRILEHFLAKIK